MTSFRPLNPGALIQRTAVAYAALLLCGTFVALPLAHAGTTDIASQPLATTSSVSAKPNLLFILDNSGSMDSDFMPDDMSSTTVYGFASAQCNGLAYDPSITYKVPVKSNGTDTYSNASFSAAKDDGYNSSSSTWDLTGSVYYLYTGSEKRMGWTYPVSTVDKTTPFYKECYSTIGYDPGKSKFTAVTVNATSAEAQNYANWYSYYRKRYLLMRTAMGRALASLDNSYRVGFSTISDTTATDGTRYFRDVKDFDSTQRTNFYSSLYTVAPSSWTPLRAALAKAGRYYANKASGQTYDPMQYSCQRNYALLSTDGYWNAHDESATYGPFQLNANTNVGNQDADESRPMRDASLLTTKVITPYTAPATSDKQSTTQSRTLPWYRTTTTIENKTCRASRTNYPYTKTVDSETATETQKRYFTTPQEGTYGYTLTVTTVEGGSPSSPVKSTPTIQGSWVDRPGATTSTVLDSDTTSAYSTTSSTVTCLSSGTVGSSSTPPTAGFWSTWSGTPTYSNVNIVTGTYTAGTPTTNTAYAGGSTDSLADVAEYYWKTDLRNSDWGNCTSSSSGASRDVCNDIVRTVDNDTNVKQHLNTFTIGLGVSGTLTYDKNYPTQTSGDYVSLTNGTKNWPNPSDGGAAVNIDDLWHAAVNGRGQYYSALNATELHEAIAGVIAKIESKAGAAAAAATSTLELVKGDSNQLFSASYTTYLWTGDLKSYSIDGKANISSTHTWSAQTKLDALAYGDRKIYFKGSAGLTPFTYDNLSTGQQAYFDNLCSQSVVSGQCATLSPTDKTLANSGTTLVNYLRGQRTYEVSTTVSGSTVAPLYRVRDHVLGDIINGAPVYVGKPPFNYADAGYADFLSTNLTRKPVVYVAANDGMLHAISADLSDGGSELWAYVPTAIMSKMYMLADINYGSKHQYYVDGAPVMGDVKIGGHWKTIMVGGFNKGGNGYYALDITDPSAPVMLWEFSDANMGLSYGNPIITKRQDGTWVVVLTSGLNNTGGDGKGHLYVLDAATGAKLQDIATSEGSATTPSGLSKINAWIDSTTDNTSLRFYGGDMLGNVWRFDTDARYATAPNAVQLAKLQIDALTPQPITTKPMTALVSDAPVVVIGTGRYLGDTDITDTTKQSIYAIRDPLGTTGWGNVRADTTNFVKQTITLSADGASATISSNKVDWTKGGWWVDLPHTRERVSVNMGLQLGTLAVGTAIPNGDACSSGGASWRYYLNVGTGSSIAGKEVGVQWSPNTLIVGISWVKDADGNVRTIFQDSLGRLKTEVPPTTASSGGGLAHRTSWRELID